jgi:hypothetical protein
MNFDFLRQKQFQSLLQLANFYAISSSDSPTLRDRIGLCYVLKNHISSSDEVLLLISESDIYNYG